MLRMILIVSCLSLWACGKDKDKTEEAPEAPIESITPGEPAAADASPGADAAAAAALNGKELYAKLCASCHQALDKTDVPKAPLKKITGAIASEPTMASLKETAAKDLEAIAAALGAASPGKGKN